MPVFAFAAEVPANVAATDQIVAIVGVPEPAPSWWTCLASASEMMCEVPYAALDSFSCASPPRRRAG
jgi:hypothetical protein